MLINPKCFNNLWAKSRAGGEGKFVPPPNQYCDELRPKTLYTSCLYFEFFGDNVIISKMMSLTLYSIFGIFEKNTDFLGLKS